MKKIFRSKWFRVVVGAFLCVAIPIICLWFTAAPCRLLPSSEWVLTEQMQRLTPDARIMQIARRAQLDYIIRPVPGRRGLLSFERALSISPNDAYLIFVLSTDPYDREVYYRVALEDGTLLWKCVAGTY
jgi:hypothetical protein